MCLSAIVQLHAISIAQFQKIEIFSMLIASRPLTPVITRRIKMKPNTLRSIISIGFAFFITVFCLIALSPGVRAQEAKGKIIGTVTDPQGSVLPGARVSVTNTSTLTTQNSREATTDADGSYQVLSLPI